MEPINAVGIWRGTPPKVVVAFLLAVFFVFSTVGFANDIMEMGRQPVLRFVSTIVLSGLFAVCYAVSGITLRGRFWMVFFPLLTLQIVIGIILTNWLPDVAPYAGQGDSGMERLHVRLIFDGVATIAAVALGYTGFVYSFVSEARRYVRTRTEMATLEGEMAAAREVQRLMVPDDLPRIDGYTIESVYCPAAEVGGDFFQVIPLKSGRALVAIGDVSGKGLRAAMIVSMIVGTLRTVSGFTEEPDEILGELNRRLCGRMHGGFATCLTIRLEDQGRLTLANAGHLPPYLNGTEEWFSGSMPLGLDESATYEQTSLQMAGDDVVVLLTDGIAEAQNEQRELFGFERVGSMLRKGASARNVADSAQQYGQNDDLTVLSLTRAM